MIARGQWTPPTQAFPAAVPPDDAGKLLFVFQSKLLIGAALLESAAFFAGIAYMLEGTTLALLLAILFALLVALQFPTRFSVEQWLDQQLRLLEEERQASKA